MTFELAKKEFAPSAPPKPVQFSPKRLLNDDIYDFCNQKLTGLEKNNI